MNESINTCTTPTARNTSNGKVNMNATTTGTDTLKINIKQQQQHSQEQSTATSNPYFNKKTDSICDNILDCIGNTPLVRLNRVGNEFVTHYELLVKCEYMNAGGSVKDRIGKQMILDAEQQNIIQPNKTILIEPTSGNTGIGIALASAVKGYQCIITMPEKMSKEKVDILKALGAEIVRTPTEAAFDAPDSHISVARRICNDTEHAHILDQYVNPSNPNAHYYGTAEELIRQSTNYDGNPIDMLVAGAGTGGTITGIAKRLKEVYPNIFVVGVDPVGSILALPETLNNEHKLESYQVEGIGYDFIPGVLDRSSSVIDYWIKTNDHESLVMMRRLIRDEGLLCGGSSGAAVAGAIKAIQQHQKQQQQQEQRTNNNNSTSTTTTSSSTNNKKFRVVIILPDSVRNYMTKALSDDWMSDHGFIDGDVIKLKTTTYNQAWWATKCVYEIQPNLNTPLTISSNILCKDAITLLKNEGFDMVPVLDDTAGGHIIGVVTEGNITKCILSGRCNPNTPIADSGVIYKTFHKFSMTSTLGELANALDHDPFVLIVTEQRCYSFEHNNSTSSTKSASPLRKRTRTDNNNNNNNNTNTTNGSTNNNTTDDDDDDDDTNSQGTDTTNGTAGNGTLVRSSSNNTNSNKNNNNKQQRVAKVITRIVVSGIVSRIDLLDYISSGGGSSSTSSSGCGNGNHNN